MRFAFVSNIYPPHQRGGYELGCRDIANALALQGHQVQVLTSAPTGSLQRIARTAQPAEVFELFAPVYVYEAPEGVERSAAWVAERRAAFGGIIPGNCLALDQHLRRYPADVIWIFNFLGLGPVGILETCLSHPSVCVVHLMDGLDGVVVDHQPAGMLLPRYAALKRDVASIACSAQISMRNAVAGPYGRSTVIYNGVHFDDIPFVERTLPAPGEPFRFVYFGQVQEAKGLLQVVRGMEQMARRPGNPPCELHVIGGGNVAFLARLAAEAKAAGLENRVHLHPPAERSDLLRDLSTYHAAIMLLSPEEPFGYAPLEAVAAGLPLVYSRGGGFEECLPRDYPLAVDDREDAIAVASRIEQCMRDYGMMLGVTRSARSFAQEKCDFVRVTLPSYMQFVQSEKPAERGYAVPDLLAAHYTSRFQMLSHPAYGE